MKCFLEVYVVDLAKLVCQQKVTILLKTNSCSLPQTYVLYNQISSDQSIVMDEIQVIKYKTQ